METLVLRSFKSEKSAAPLFFSVTILFLSVLLSSLKYMSWICSVKRYVRADLSLSRTLQFLNLMKYPEQTLFVL